MSAICKHFISLMYFSFILHASEMNCKIWETQEIFVFFQLKWQNIFGTSSRKPKAFSICCNIVLHDKRNLQNICYIALLTTRCLVHTEILPLWRNWVFFRYILSLCWEYFWANKATCIPQSSFPEKTHIDPRNTSIARQVKVTGPRLETFLNKVFIHFLWNNSEAAEQLFLRKRKSF